MARIKGTYQHSASGSAAVQAMLHALLASAHAVSTPARSARTALKPGWLASARSRHACFLDNPEAAGLLAAAASGEYELGSGSTPCAEGGEFVVSWSTGGFIRFADSSYKGMLDDGGRTPAFEAAIRARVERQPGLLVLDIGTGPFAVLAIAAARAGAGKVYAVEHDLPVAAKARAAIEAAGLSEIVEVVEGMSTAITLPEKVDLVLAEVIGTYATEEGCYHTIRDAHARHVKAPTRRDSWIPHTCQTWAAPGCFALHYALGLPAYNWGYDAGSKEHAYPVRLSPSNPALRMLAPPALLEEVCFADPDLPHRGNQPADGEASFTISEEALAASEAALEALLLEQGGDDEQARSFAAAAGRSLSGVAVWPRLLLDDDDARIVQARGDMGEHIVQPLTTPLTTAASGASLSTSWWTLLPMVAPRPLTLTPSQTPTPTPTLTLSLTQTPTLTRSRHAHWR